MWLTPRHIDQPILTGRTVLSEVMSLHQRVQSINYDLDDSCFYLSHPLQPERFHLGLALRCFTCSVQHTAGE